MSRKPEKPEIKKVIHRPTGEERSFYVHADHSFSENRRSFLQASMGATGFIFLPSILNVLARPEFAMAADDSCGAAAGVQMPAYININGSGGFSLSKNFIPLGQDRNPLSKYSQLGFGADPTFITNSTQSFDTLQSGYRAPGDKSGGSVVGRFWTGLLGSATAATVANASIVHLWTKSDDDSGNNPAFAGGMIGQVLAGSILPPLGTSSSATGVGQAPAILSGAAPLRVGAFSTIESSIAPSGALAASMSKPQLTNLLALVNTLSGKQARDVASVGGATSKKLASLIECATGKNVELATTAPKIDPGLDNRISGYWGISASNKGTGNYTQAAIIYNALLGNGGVAGIDIGGCDYHGDTVGNQGNKDQEIGTLAGKILETARLLNVPVMVDITTDGSVSYNSDTFGTAASNDSGTRGGRVFLFYNPNGRAQIKNDAFKHQIGCMTSGQVSSVTSVVNSPEKGAAASFANYLKFAQNITGMQLLGKLDIHAPGVFTTSDLSEVIRLA